MKRGPNFYAIMLRFYPRSFREAFGEDMRQVFRDQYREVKNGRGRFRFASLWVRTVADLFTSLFVQHLEAIKEHMNIHSMARSVSFVRLSAAIAACLTAFCVLATLFILPRQYEGLARIEIDAGSSAQGPFDPFRLQTAVEVLRSERILGPVVANYGLAKRFAQSQGMDRISQSEALQFLRDHLTIRQAPKTALLEIRFLSDDARLSAGIANSIATIFARERPGYSVQLVDPAIPANRAVRPNVPLNVLTGALLSIGAALLIAGTIYRALKALARRETLAA